jgi:hypothetical protein
MQRRVWEEMEAEQVTERSSPLLRSLGEQLQDAAKRFDRFDYPHMRDYLRSLHDHTSFVLSLALHQTPPEGEEFY